MSTPDRLLNCIGFIPDSHVRIEVVVVIAPALSQRIAPV